MECPTFFILMVYSRKTSNKEIGFNKTGLFSWNKESRAHHGQIESMGKYLHQQPYTKQICVIPHIKFRRTNVQIAARHSPRPKQNI